MNLRTEKNKEKVFWQKQKRRISLAATKLKATATNWFKRKKPAVQPTAQQSAVAAASGAQRVEPKRRLRGWIILIVLLALLLIWWFLGKYWLGLGIFLVILQPVFRYLLYSFLKYLAGPYKRYFFTSVVEPTAQIVVKGGALYGALIQKKGYTFDKDWCVVPEGVPVKDGEVVSEGTLGAEIYFEPKHHFGGIRYYGFYPLFNILLHNLRWYDVEDVKDKGATPQFHEKEDMDYVLLQPDIYYRQEAGVETGYLREPGSKREVKTEEMERIAIKAEFLVTMEVVNPCRALFSGAPQYIENTLLKLSPVLRTVVTSRDLDTLLLLEGSGIDILGSLPSGDVELIEMLKKKWGMKIHAIQIWRITPPPEIQNALVEERRQELQSRGRAAKTAGAALGRFCLLTGMRSKEVQEGIRKDPNQFLSKYRDIWDRSWEVTIRELGAEAGAYTDLRTANIGIDIAAVLSGLAQSFSGKKRKENGRRGKGEREESKKEKIEQEED